MGWHYKPPQNFPAAYCEAIRLASKNLSEPHMLGGFTDSKKAKILAEKFRHLKWCIKQIPSAHQEMYDIITNYDVRTFITEELGFFTLWLVVKPTKISQFAELNPKLAAEILPQV